MPPAVTHFAQKISRYFMDFLRTDFKKSAAPRRKIQLQTEAGFRCGIPLRQYSTLLSAIWKQLAAPMANLKPLRIGRNRYTTPISPVLKNLVNQQIDALDGAIFNAVHDDTLARATDLRERATQNPEAFVDEVIASFAEAVSKRVIHPLLSLLNESFQQQSYAALESIFEVEHDLVESLCAATISNLPIALNTFIVTGKLEPVQAVLTEFFVTTDARTQLKAFFDGFAAADAYQALRDLWQTMRTGDNLAFYIYLCELRFDKLAFPLFYIPVQLNLDEKTSEYVLELNPHLYTNRDAVDFILQELKPGAGQSALFPIAQRIIYPLASASFLDEISHIVTKITPVLDLSGAFDVRLPTLQTIRSSQLKLSKASYLSVFDKSDESQVNDYEALLTATGADQNEVNQLFNDIIQRFITEEPQSIWREVEEAWENTPIVDRLVGRSPIPLNEEQRKILAALAHPACRFVTVQGPPGTGKSHTITAIAFDSIVSARSLLILSDKKEALDVVEDKLQTALASVRQDDDFPNPILRLGKAGNSYPRLVSSAAVEKIKTYWKVTKGQAERLADETAAQDAAVRADVAQTITAYSSVTLKDLARLRTLEGHITTHISGLLPLLQTPLSADAVQRLAADLLSSDERIEASRFIASHLAAGSLLEIVSTLQATALLTQLSDVWSMRHSLALFAPLGMAEYAALERFILAYHAIRKPIVGFLFSRAQAQALDQQLANELPCVRPLAFHKQLSKLREVHLILTRIAKTLQQTPSSPDLMRSVYHVLLNSSTPPASVSKAGRWLEALSLLAGEHSILPKLMEHGALKELKAAPHMHSAQNVQALLDLLHNVSEYSLLWQTSGAIIRSAPSFNYVREMERLAQLHTTRMSSEIDGRFLNFIDDKSATAKTLAEVIKAKQKFPVAAFDALTQAFPVIIASIRDFAEYVPLKRGVFDLVVIDEASQVSIAQAFPALLRAKKVVVLGDQRQFSNVKSSQASLAMNNGYRSELEAYFRIHISDAADRIQRLKQFDVKKSVLEFFELIANYRSMLKKHFRGYQALISLSSKFFYDNALQAIKVRSKPINEILEFSWVTPANTHEPYRNVNSAEGEFIVALLRTMIDEANPHSVAIITPFREQQQYLAKTIFHDPYASQFEQCLRLKIMTFDTCQGEERDLVIYSMVAVPSHDSLNYIFPLTLEDIAERAEDALKVQRLNVGFSRAKEKMHFVLSKPIEHYKGSIGQVLAHYQSILQRDRTDQASSPAQSNSPLAQKVLGWLLATPFYQLNQDEIEIVSPFPVSVYLQQLDPSYQHPVRRIDLLLRFYGGQKTVNAVLEYDDFEENAAQNGNSDHSSLSPTYYRTQDIEQQFILESYGYTFIRLNRFNLGEDPVQALSERLFALVDAARHVAHAAVVTDIHSGIKKLDDGSAKICRRCQEIKNKEAFFDQTLSAGQGGYGHICIVCKAQRKKRRLG